MPTVRRGDSGPEVMRLQLLLNEMLVPSPGLRDDGDFGEETERAVRRFQALHHLATDGRVGPLTWSALGMRAWAGDRVPPAPAAGEAPWLAVARGEIGQRERGAPGADNPRIVAYHQTTTFRATDDETPWCASFVNWVLIRAGYRGTNSARARDWLAWGRPLTVPQPGAVVVLHRKGGGRRRDGATGSSSGFHVAFFISTTGTHVRLLGGNQSDQVKETNFALAAYDVRGYRWPE